MPKNNVINHDYFLLGKYIRQIENPDSVGWDPQRHIWTAPNLKGYDKKSRGMGVDIENNAAAKKLTANRRGKYLTEQEERALRNAHIDYSLGALDRHDTIPGIKVDEISPRKKAEVVGLIYRGDANQIWDSNTTLGKAYRSSNENDFHKAVDKYYINKGLPERARNNDVFWEDHPQHSPRFGGATSTWAEGGALNKSEWDRLSMAEKADVMKLAIEGGVYDLDTIRSGYNKFAEGGREEVVVDNTDTQYINTMERVAEENYKKWGFSNPDEALIHALNDNTYNYRGYYNKYPQSKANADTHWTDEFKTVYHPTFSQESIYSGKKSQYNPKGRTGGFWLGEVFVPAPWQLFSNYAEGGKIHIAPSKKGTFTAAASRHGKSVQEFASQVLAHPENYSPAMRKKANFAKNAAKWKYEDGGILEIANEWANSKNEHPFITPLKLF